MKYAYILILLFASFLNGNAQCSTKNYKTSDGTSVREANFEVLYKYVGEENNGDYSMGYTQVHGRLARMSRSAAVLWELQVTVDTKRQTPLAPRRLVFYFTNGGTLTLNAVTYQEVQGTIQMCEFEVTDDVRSQLRNPIRQIEIIDTRAERMYVSKKQYGLYEGVFAEQISCLN
jgi:hypothetical protein